MTNYLIEALAFSEEKYPLKCNHYWVEGYIGELMYYCNKCNKDLETEIGNNILKTHDVVNGELINRKNKAL